MRYLIKSTNICTRVKIAAEKFGFTIKTDLATSSSSSSIMYSIFDDVLMTVSHYNSVSEEKTATYKLFNCENATQAYYIIALLARVLSFDLTIASRNVNMGRITLGDSLRDTFLSFFNEENKFGRAVKFGGFTPIVLDETFPGSMPPAPQLKSNIGIFKLNVGRADNSIESSRIINSISVNYYTVKNMEELLGCSADELINGLNGENGLNDMREMITRREQISKHIKTPQLFNLNQDGLITNYDRNRSTLEYILLRGTRFSLLVMVDIFLSAIDLSRDIFCNILAKSNGGETKGYSVPYGNLIPQMSFVERLGEGRLSLMLFNPANWVDFKPHTFDLLSNKYGYA